MQQFTFHMAASILQDEQLSVILCDPNGIILNLSAGVKRHFPHIFRIHTSLWETLGFVDEISHLKNALASQGYYCSAVFSIGLGNYFLCCTAVSDETEQKNYLLCKLEESDDCEIQNEGFVRHRTAITRKNDTLIDTLLRIGEQNPTENGKVITDIAEALIRNRVLSDIFHALPQIGKKEETVLLEQLCSAFIKQVNTALKPHQCILTLECQTEGKPLYCDTDAFYTMLSCLTALFCFGKTPASIYLLLSEKSGKVTLQASCNITGSSSNASIAPLLQESIRQFALHYGGSCFTAVNNDIQKAVVSFLLSRSPYSGATEIFENECRHHYMIERMLPLLYYADR